MNTAQLHKLDQEDARSLFEAGWDPMQIGWLAWLTMQGKLQPDCPPLDSVQEPVQLLPLREIAVIFAAYRPPRECEHSMTQLHRGGALERTPSGARVYWRLQFCRTQFTCVFCHEVRNAWQQDSVPYWLEPRGLRMACIDCVRVVPAASHVD